MTVDLPPMPDYCWPVDWGCISEEKFDALDPEVVAYAEAMAASTLRSLTLYQVGGCPATVRPCSEGCGGHGWRPNLSGGKWTNVTCGCGRALPCSCGSLSVVRLDTPVGMVEEVRIDGAVLDPGAYTLYSGGLLVRTDGDPWPACQDLSAPLDEENTFAVTYLNAYPVDGLGARAAGVLANEYAKACTGAKCALPSGVTQITRQGISMEVSRDMFGDGMTGIRSVDDYTARFNPNRLRRKPRVHTPDLPDNPRMLA